MKKWIIRPHRSSKHMLGFADGYYWTTTTYSALKFDTRMDAVQTAHKASPGEFAVMEIEI